MQWTPGLPPTVPVAPVVDSKSISRSPQGTPASAGLRSAERLTPSPRALPHVLIPSGSVTKTRQRKEDKEIEAIDCVAFYFFNLFCLKSASLRNQSTRQHEMISSNHVAGLSA